LHRSKFTGEALENIKKLPRSVKNSLKKEFQKKIHIDPTGCSEPLTGMLSDFRSFHFGSYRVVYRVFEGIRTVSVVGIGKKDKKHQTDLYKRLETLAQTGKLAAAVLETYRSIDR
jgi:mRNA-degrading endonuclease RelE of RelBE toxin-antitoxin system